VLVLSNFKVSCKYYQNACSDGILKKQSSKGKGIFGTVLAFSGADEDQGCKTLH
jgi:hypothetical protein